MSIIEGKQVENLVTKFYYKQKQLYFQIILKLKGKQEEVYKEYVDYALYRQAFVSLLDAKKTNQKIKMP